MNLRCHPIRSSNTSLSLIHTLSKLSSDTKISQLDSTCLRDKNVPCLDVTVDLTLPMEISNSLEEREGIRNGRRGRRRRLTMRSSFMT
jgi:hypothetical protein